MAAVGVSVAVAVHIGVDLWVEVGSSVAVAEGEGASVFVGGSVAIGTAVSCAKDTGSAVAFLLKPSVVSLLLMAIVGTNVGGIFVTVRQALIKIVTATSNKRRFFINYILSPLYTLT